MKRTKYNIVLNESEIDLLLKHFKVVTSFIDQSRENINFNKLSEIYALGVHKQIETNVGNALNTLQEFITDTNDWLFGCLAYDLHSEIETIKSNNSDDVNLPDLYFFVPKFILTKKENRYELLCFKKDKLEFDSILKGKVKKKAISVKPITLIPRISKEEYTQSFNQIQNHISMGDLYVMNYCQEFFQKDAEINPYELFKKLVNKAKSPFMAFFKLNGKFVLSASPERFLQNTSNVLISQPIKGTAKRAKNSKEDKDIVKELLKNTKESSENTMIIDLVRNDLGKCCEPGSVKVLEFQKVYSYPTVHQLVSTIEGKSKLMYNFTDIIKSTFPMGSMTGAPKVNAIKIAEKLEANKRGWYSGALGYIKPNGDFDFSVVIRSLIYNQKTNYLSYSVGGGITAQSNVEDEYNECLLKLNSLINLLNEV